MFKRMYLTLEENRLRDRFEGTIAAAIIEVLNKETNDEHLEFIFRVLHQFNDIVKMVDESLGIVQGNEDWEAYDNASHEKYINILLDALNKLHIRFGNLHFLHDFSEIYWCHNQNFILQLWREMPEGKSVKSNEASFIKVFEDLLSGTLKEFPHFLVKQLKDFKNLYRASRHEVYDNYKYILPNPQYVKDNRWNDDGVAFLYLAYDNDNLNCGNIKQVKRTCFEEIRAKDGEELSVCRFKAVHRRTKILDLSFDGIDYDEQVGKLNALEPIYKNQMMKSIQTNTKMKKRLEGYAKAKDEEAFMIELEKIQKKLGIDVKMHRDVQWQLSVILIGNICDAIFYAVDKEDDPDLEAYIPFRAFSRYLIANGFGGVAYRSTRMQKIGLHGKCLTLFDKEDATFIDGEMEVYRYHQDKCEFIKKYYNI